MIDFALAVTAHFHLLMARFILAIFCFYRFYQYMIMKKEKLLQSCV